MAGNFFLLSAVVSMDAANNGALRELSTGKGRLGIEQSTTRVSLIPTFPELPLRFPQFLKQKPGSGSDPEKSRKRRMFLH